MTLLSSLLPVHLRLHVFPSHLHIRRYCWQDDLRKCSGFRVRSPARARVVA
eukprot:EC785513.1.p4 GENE.EC785513.1~~EC785513.1.p4  ORF type:complete len:51 (-),score=3.61 EC785513.1:68-220(-)